MADWTRLSGAIEGEVLTDAFSRGRYATDASFYQIVPRAVVIPRRFDDVAATLEFARSEGVPLTARGGGTSQAGQTVNSGVVIDFSCHLHALQNLDVAARRATVEPGLVLDDLNRRLKPHGLWFPVDVSTASRATLGGMAANNSCGGRSIRVAGPRQAAGTFTVTGMRWTHPRTASTGATPSASRRHRSSRETAGSASNSC
jgi:FAD/FMN-containing dehydrogenase